MKIEELKTENTLIELLGIETIELTPERVVMKMPIGPRVHQPYGILHGGASVVLAESAASVGAVLHCNLEEKYPVGLEINANHLRSKKDGYVIAEAIPLHKGRTTMVWDIKIRDEEERLVCVSRCTIAFVENKKKA